MISDVFSRLLRLSFAKLLLVIGPISFSIGLLTTVVYEAKTKPVKSAALAVAALTLIVAAVWLGRRFLRRVPM